MWNYHSTNTYCSNACQADWKWRNVTILQIEAGEKSYHAVNTLKRYLCEKVGEKCAVCGQLPEWQGKPLVLQVDHIDGNSDNNFPSNIRLICPNCHTQTDTFGTKGQGSRYQKVTKRNAYIREYRGSLAQR